MKVSDLFIQKNICALYHYTRLENVDSIENDKKIYSRSILNEKNIVPEYITNSLSRSLDLYHGNHYYVFLETSAKLLKNKLEKWRKKSKIW